MFQSESLQEKWKPLLNYEGLDEIKDPHRKAVTAVLLENQEKFLREESAFSSSGMLMEQPTVNTQTSASALSVLIPIPTLYPSEDADDTGFRTAGFVADTEVVPIPASPSTKPVSALDALSRPENAESTSL